MGWGMGGGGGGRFHCYFSLHFSIMNETEHLFICLLANCLFSIDLSVFEADL